MTDQSNEFSVLNLSPVNHLKEPMFFGSNINIARFDTQKHPIIEELTEKQQARFWRPNEVSITLDGIQFKEDLTDNERHIFLSNIKYQILLDSVQGRSPSVALLPLVSIPELESWIETWSFFESIHSRSYTHIIRGITNNPSKILDSVVLNKRIIERGNEVKYYYDSLISLSYKYLLNKDSVDIVELKTRLILCMASIYCLEGIRFFVSFACSFSFAERKLMEGNAKIIKLIARDEAFHLTVVQVIMNLWRDGRDDQQMTEIYHRLKPRIIGIFDSVVKQEIEWSQYLFKDGSMLGLNEQILKNYVQYITNIRLSSLGFEKRYDVSNNPLPWMSHWLENDKVQVALQETENSGYLDNQVNMDLDRTEFKEFSY